MRYSIRQKTPSRKPSLKRDGVTENDAIPLLFNLYVKGFICENSCVQILCYVHRSFSIYLTLLLEK